MKTISLTLVILVTVGATLGQALKPRPIGKSSPPVIEKAVWNPGWESVLGITEADFRTLGFDAQSKEQAVQIFSYLIKNRPSFHCEKYYKDKEELKRVHVFVEGAASPSNSLNMQEFVGQLRSRLSSIHDVSLVYSDSDADIVLRALALQNENQDNRRIGYTASILVLTPCTFKSASGYDKGETTVLWLRDHLLSTDSSEENVLSRVSSTLDVNDFDEVRKQHAENLRLRSN